MRSLGAVANHSLPFFDDSYLYLELPGISVRSIIVHGQPEDAASRDFDLFSLAVDPRLCRLVFLAGA